jgi:hypothetical protein
MTRNKIFILIGSLQVLSLINIMPYYIRLAPQLAAHVNIFDQSNTPFPLIVLFADSSVFIDYRFHCSLFSAKKNCSQIILF